MAERELGRKNREEEGERWAERRRRRRRAEKKTQKSNPAEMYFPVETHRNTLKQPKHTETPRNFMFALMNITIRNRSKFFPRWNKGVSHSGLHTSTRFSGWNRTVYTTLVDICHSSINRLH